MKHSSEFIGFVLMCLLFIGNTIKENDQQQAVERRFKKQLDCANWVIEMQHKQIAKANLYLSTNYPVQVTIVNKEQYLQKSKGQKK